VIVVAVAGMPGSGKSEVVSILTENAHSVSMGDIVREFTERKGLEMSPGNVGNVAVMERELFGMDVWAHRTVERLSSLSVDMVVIDGLRGGAEVDVFRANWGDDFSLIAVHATPETRYSRMLERKRADDPGAEVDLQERDMRELSWGAKEAIEGADHTLINEGTLDDLRAGVKKLLVELGALRD